jgi:hypothetical protein
MDGCIEGILGRELGSAPSPTGMEKTVSILLDL